MVVENNVIIEKINYRRYFGSDDGVWLNNKKSIPCKMNLPLMKKRYQKFYKGILCIKKKYQVIK